MKVQEQHTNRETAAVGDSVGASGDSVGASAGGVGAGGWWRFRWKFWFWCDWGSHSDSDSEGPCDNILARRNRYCIQIQDFLTVLFFNATPTTYTLSLSLSLRLTTCYCYC